MKIQRDFLWGGMGQDLKFHLVNWKQVCTPIRYGGLGIQTAVRQMELKIWHCENSFMAVSDYFKYGCLWGDWCSRNVTGPYWVCFWKAISNGWDRFLQFVSYKVGDGSSIKFWTDRWCGETSLKVRFPDLYRIARHKDASVRDLMSYKSSTLQWDVCFVCRVQDWEVDTITVFMDLLYSVKIRRDEADALYWNPSSRDIYDVKSFYKVLQCKTP